MGLETEKLPPGKRAGMTLTKTTYKNRILRAVTALGLGLATLTGVSTAAHAQTFTNTTVGNINDTTLCPGATGTGTTANLTRTFAVTGQPTVTNLNVGLIASHAWRGDMRVTLSSPGPTPVTVVLINEDTSNSGNVDNYNIELGDEAAVTVNEGTGGQEGAHVTTDTPYRWLVRPDNPLSNFNGTNPNGTWTLSICDDYAGQNGQFIQAGLIFPTPGVADLSLTSSVSAFPEAGALVPLTFTLANGGAETATSTVQINLPVGVNYDSHSGGGTYNSATGLWTPPANLASGATSTLTLNVIATTSGSYSVTSEVASSNRADPNSTPGNNSTSEDDDTQLSFVAQPPPIPPSLTCPIADRFTHNWTTTGATSWTVGNTSQTYPPVGSPVPAGEERLAFALTGALAERQASGGVQTPVVQTNVTGGLTANQEGLHIAADYTAVANNLIMDIDVGDPGVGVDSLQFQIFDVDLGGWIDRITVTGDLDGASMPVTLTRSGANYIDGNQAIGFNGSDNSTGNGNITITFTNPVDHVRFVYDNDPSIGPNPAFQIISVHDITTCPRTQADISAVKTVEIFDPGNLGLYMTPGNEVLYKITVTNSATATAQADDVDLSDTLPANLKFVSATTTGFTAGAFGSPALPAANTDCGTTPCVVSYQGGSLPINTVGEIVVRAVIK